VVLAQATTFSMQVFEGLWGTNELLSSFDSINILKPGQHESSTDGWLHVDQAPLRKGVACIQGLVNMVDVSPETGQSELQMLLVHPDQHIIVMQCLQVLSGTHSIVLPDTWLSANACLVTHHAWLLIMTIPC